ncbi:RWD domain-containing protein 4-like isoform X2 [Watersipora subatra]|uniref:RWD domain-containing protein 4-like isoform X2 n=1 Tax=Watersipora subatra TaxID=2589382 RepID=UPI00355C3F76
MTLKIKREVLLSIYEGDDDFFDITPTQYQYKIGEDGDNKSAIIEVSWGENYPEELPTIHLDVFYNKHLLQEVKDAIKSALTTEAENLLGCGSTYTLFEYAKENKEDLMQLQTDKVVIEEAKPEQAIATETVKAGKQKKEQLSKNQKRRLYDKFGTQGMMEGKQRGWNWVDLIRHLSQTGSKLDGQ